MAFIKKMGFKMAVGSRAQVFNGTAKYVKYIGGLQKSDLKKNLRTGRIVPKKKSEAARKNFPKVQAKFAPYQFRK